MQARRNEFWFQSRQLLEPHLRYVRREQDEQDRSVLEGLTQGVLHAVSFEGEIRKRRRGPRADLRAYLVRKDAGRACQQKVDQIPPLVGIQLVGEAGHNSIVTPVAHPPKHFTDLVREQVRFGQISRRIGSLPASGPSPRPVAPWHMAQFSA